MKQRIVSLLVWLLNKIDPDRCEIKQFITEHELKINYKKFTPRDNAWHNIKLTFSVWVKYKEPDRDKEERVYIDEKSLTLTEGIVTDDELPLGKNDGIKNPDFTDFKEGQL